MTDDSAQQPTENDQSAQHSFDLGNQALKTGRYDEAIQHFSRAIQLKPDFAEAYFNRGVTYACKGELDQAIADYDRVIELKPDWVVDAYVRRAVAYLQKRNLDRAFRDFNEARKRNPNNENVLLLGGTLYVLKREWQNAINNFNKVVKSLESTQTPELKKILAVVYCMRGICYFARRALKRAFAECNKALELEPNLVVAWLLRGLLYLATGVWEDAVSDFNKAIELDSKCTEAYFARAELYYSLGALEGALHDAATLEELVTKSEDKGRLKLLKGKLSLAENKFSEAIQHFQKARELIPTEIVIYLWLMYARYLEITFKVRADIYSKPKEKINISEHPDFQKELNSLITQLSELKRFLERERARRWWWTQNFFQRQLKELIQLFSFRKDPEVEQLKTIDYWLGVLYYQLNDFSHTIENLKAACQLDKSFEEAKTLLDSIWNFSYRSTWWRWWFFTPSPLYPWWKRFWGSLLLLGAWGALLLPLVQALMWGQSPLAPLYYLGPAILAVAILLSPVLVYLRAGPVEVEMISPPPESFFPHPAMEDFLKRIEVWSFLGPKSKTF